MTGAEINIWNIIPDRKIPPPSESKYKDIEDYITRLEFSTQKKNYLRKVYLGKPSRADFLNATNEKLSSDFMTLESQLSRIQNMGISEFSSDFSSIYPEYKINNNSIMSIKKNVISDLIKKSILPEKYKNYLEKYYIKQPLRIESSSSSSSSSSIAPSSKASSSKALSSSSSSSSNQKILTTLDEALEEYKKNLNFYNKTIKNANSSAKITDEVRLGLVEWLNTSNEIKDKIKKLITAKSFKIKNLKDILNEINNKKLFEYIELLDHNLSSSSNMQNYILERTNKK